MFNTVTYRIPIGGDDGINKYNSILATYLAKNYVRGSLQVHTIGNLHETSVRFDSEELKLQSTPSPGLSYLTGDFPRSVYLSSNKAIASQSLTGATYRIYVDNIALDPRDTELVNPYTIKINLYGDRGSDYDGIPFPNLGTITGLTTVSSSGSIKSIDGSEYRSLSWYGWVVTGNVSSNYGNNAYSRMRHGPPRLYRTALSTSTVDIAMRAFIGQSNNEILDYTFIANQNSNNTRGWLYILYYSPASFDLLEIIPNNSSIITSSNPSIILNFSKPLLASLVPSLLTRIGLSNVKDASYSFPSSYTVLGDTNSIRLNFDASLFAHGVHYIRFDTTNLYAKDGEPFRGENLIVSCIYRAEQSISSAGVTDHALLSNLTVGDPHTQYLHINPSTSSRNVIQGTVGTVVPLTLREFGSQSGDAFRYEGSTGRVLTRIDKTGKLYINGIDGSGQVAVNFGEPTGSTNLTTKNYVDIADASTLDTLSAYSYLSVDLEGSLPNSRRFRTTGYLDTQDDGPGGNLQISLNTGSLATAFALTGHNHRLSGLTDVSVSGALNNQVLKFNGSSWVPGNTGSDPVTKTYVDTTISASGRYPDPSGWYYEPNNTITGALQEIGYILSGSRWWNNFHMGGDWHSTNAVYVSAGNLDKFGIGPYGPQYGTIGQRTFVVPPWHNPASGFYVELGWFHTGQSKNNGTNPTGQIWTVRYTCRSYTPNISTGYGTYSYITKNLNVSTGFTEQAYNGLLTGFSINYVTTGTHLNFTVARVTLGVNNEFTGNIYVDGMRIGSNNVRYS